MHEVVSYGADGVQLEHVGEGIYVCNGSVARRPKHMQVNGQRLTRFMDEIYIPASSEGTLSASQFSVLNAARRELMKHDRRSVELNDLVKTRFGQVINYLRPGVMVEWGCGYSPISDSFAPPHTRHVGVDLDPRVCSELRSKGSSACLPSEISEDLYGTTDLVVMVFVMHFQIPFTDLEVINRLVGSSGAFVFNLYRFDDNDRRAEIARQFVDLDLPYLVADDPSSLCRDHTYWVVSRQQALLQPLIGLFTGP